MLFFHSAKAKDPSKVLIFETLSLSISEVLFLGFLLFSLYFFFFPTGYSDFSFSLMGFCFSLHSILFFSIWVFVGFLDPKRWVYGFWRSVSIFFTLFLSFALFALVLCSQSCEESIF